MGTHTFPTFTTGTAIEWFVGLEDADFGGLAAVGWNREIELAELGGETGVAGALAGWDWSEGVVGVGVALLDDVEGGRRRKRRG